MTAAKFVFSTQPTARDFAALMEHVLNASSGDLHPDLRTQRLEVARQLRRMIDAPELDGHRSYYHTLRLFVF